MRLPRQLFDAFLMAGLLTPTESGDAVGVHSHRFGIPVSSTPSVTEGAGEKSSYSIVQTIKSSFDQIGPMQCETVCEVKGGARMESCVDRFVAAKTVCHAPEHCDAPRVETFDVRMLYCTGHYQSALQNVGRSASDRRIMLKMVFATKFAWKVVLSFASFTTVVMHPRRKYREIRCASPPFRCVPNGARLRRARLATLLPTTRRPPHQSVANDMD